MVIVSVDYFPAAMFFLLIYICAGVFTSVSFLANIRVHKPGHRAAFCTVWHLEYCEILAFALQCVSASLYLFLIYSVHYYYY